MRGTEYDRRMEVITETVSGNSTDISLSRTHGRTGGISAL